MNIVTLVDQIAKSAGVLGWLYSRCSNGVTILMYHKVLPAHLVPLYPLPNLVVEQSLFERQMAWLSNHFEVLTVSDAMGRMEKIGAGEKLHRPLACVTFDDGYRDNFDYAAPILEAHGLRGTFFITTGFVEGTPLWFDRASMVWSYEARHVVIDRVSNAIPASSAFINRATTLEGWLAALKQLPTKSRNSVLAAFSDRTPTPKEVFAPMVIEQLRHLAESGHEICAHSETHPILTDLDESELRLELEQSRATLSIWTKQQIMGFCYPNGSYDGRVVHAVRAAGYRYACTVRRGLARQNDDPMTLARRAMFSSPRHGGEEGCEAEVVGWHDLLRHSKKKLLSSPASFLKRIALIMPDIYFHRRN